MLWLLCGLKELRENRTVFTYTPNLSKALSTITQRKKAESTKKQKQKGDSQHLIRNVHYYASNRMDVFSAFA